MVGTHQGVTVDDNVCLTLIGAVLLIGIIAFVLTGHTTAAMIFGAPLVWVALGLF